MFDHVATRILDWLRAGYPEGIPTRDYIPLVALLRRRMTEDDIVRVGKRLERAGLLPSDESQVGAEMLRILDELPTPGEIHLVSMRLQADDWLLDEDERDGRRPLSGPNVHLICGRDESGTRSLALRLAGAGAIRFGLTDWVSRLSPCLNAGGNEFLPSSAGIRALIWDAAEQVVLSGRDVVLEWNSSSRAERVDAVSRARRLGAQVVLHELPDNSTSESSASKAESSGEAAYEPPSEGEGLLIVRH